MQNLNGLLERVKKHVNSRSDSKNKTKKQQGQPKINKNKNTIKIYT